MSLDTASPITEKPAARPLANRILEAVMTQRIVLLGVLIVGVVLVLMYLSANGYLTGEYDFDYMSATLIDAVPLALLGFAELIVIVSGRGGIDLSVGAMVSLVGMIFG
ncbi:MAG: rhamnose transport system permease protein, partial [Mycobacterium sp.]|nr:rhamnose transport system permease protein [Mycobacterium sp.]